MNCNNGRLKHSSTCLLCSLCAWEQPQNRKFHLQSYLLGVLFNCHFVRQLSFFSFSFSKDLVLLTYSKELLLSYLPSFQVEDFGIIIRIGQLNDSSLYIEVVIPFIVSHFDVQNGGHPLKSILTE